MTELLTKHNVEICKLCSISNDYLSYFYGYFDQNSFSFDEKSHLIHSISNPYEYPKKNNTNAEIMSVSLSDPKEKVMITKTSCWNFQQGSLAQFIDNSNNIILNKEIKGKPGTAVISNNGEVLCFFNTLHHAYCIKNSVILTLDDETIEQFQYGYHFWNWNQIKTKSPSLIYRSLNTNFYEKININDIFCNSSINLSDFHNYFICHPKFNPSGSMLAFIFRYQNENSFWSSMLIIHDRILNKFKFYFEQSNTSHFCWLDENQVIVWQGLSGYMGKIKKLYFLKNSIIQKLYPIYRYLMSDKRSARNFLVRERYCILKVNENKTMDIDFSFNWKDGHPVRVSSDVFLTDTYENLNHYRSLLLVNLKNRTKSEIGLFKSDKSTDRTIFRADLHPRISRSGRYCSVDRMVNGKRHVDVFEFKIRVTK